jgi:hypothetical protein
VRRFEPWIGKNYSEGLDGLRLLVLGESHWGPKRWEYSEFTRDVLKRECFEKRDRFFTFIAKLARGVPPGEYLEDDEREDFWNRVAFYNYVPSIVRDRPRHRPSEDQWKAAPTQLRDVLKKLKPHAILVLGKELWWRLNEQETSSFLGANTKLRGGLRDFRCQPSDHVAVAMMIQHPSSFGMRYADWRPRVQKLLAHVRRTTLR